MRLNHTAKLQGSKFYNLGDERPKIQKKEKKKKDKRKKTKPSGLSFADDDISNEASDFKIKKSNRKQFTSKLR